MGPLVTPLSLSQVSLRETPPSPLSPALPCLIAWDIAEFRHLPEQRASGPVITGSA